MSVACCSVADLKKFFNMNPSDIWDNIDKLWCRKIPLLLFCFTTSGLKKSSPECPHSCLLKTLFSYLELEEHIYCIEFNWACVQLCTVGKIRFFKHEKGKPSFMSFRTVEVLFHEISHIQAGLSLLLCLHLINMHTVPRGLLLCVLVYAWYCFTLKIPTWICDY